MKKRFTLIELLVVTAQFLCDFAKKTITVFADAKNVITRKFLERIEGVRGRKGEPFFQKGFPFTPGSIYPHRTSGRNRHHRHSCGNAAASSEQGKSQGPGDRLLE